MMAEPGFSCSKWPVFLALLVYVVSSVYCADVSDLNLDNPLGRYVIVNTF